jgi:hypothetical protein
LTFAIYGLGTDGRPMKESKGSLEVVNVVGEHLSQTRITGQVDPIRDPVVTGDVLMNPAWDPNQKRHLAIAGIMDLTGDLRRDRPSDVQRAIDEFKRSLENQNMVVDAWIDFIDSSVKGTGVSRNTDYLILGPLPEGKAGVIREDDPKSRQREDIQKLATKMQDDATKAGVPIIKLRDFLTMTGHRPPRSTQEDTLSRVHTSLPATGSPVEKSVLQPREAGAGKGPEK